MKKLSRKEMKYLNGGYETPNCTASATCANGHTYTCAGNTGTALGSTMGCNGSDGNGVSCYYLEGGVWRYSGYSCQHGPQFGIA